MAKFQVQKKCCGQCLFTKNKVVTDERKSQILDDCKTNNNFFECHKGTIKNQHVMCRGFFDKNWNGDEVQKTVTNMLIKLGDIEFVQVN